MLLIQSNSLGVSLDGDERLRLLDALRTKMKLTPLIRSLRRRIFELLAADGGDAAFVVAAAAEFERQCIAHHELKAEGAYTPGEIFCADDCIFFLIFGAGGAGGAGSREGLSAGVVYNVETTDPLAKLARFCADVRAALIEIDQPDAGASSHSTTDATAKTTAGEPNATTAAANATAAAANATTGAAIGDEIDNFPLWEMRAAPSSQGLARFIAMQPTDFIVASKCKGGARGLLRASEMLESQSVRLFLRRVQEMRREGFSSRRLFAEAGALATGGVSVERMLEAGLLEREVRVSCRQSGHALFDLPTPDSLAAITISKAKCSLCAAPVADEVIEETINPTWLAVSLLTDGGWLNQRVQRIIRALGVPASEIAGGPPSAHGESSLAANVCGNSFLFVTKDGDLTPAFCRRISETVAETDAAHLVIVITGAVEDEARLRLYEFAWRRARDGQDLDTTIVEGFDAAQREIERAFERAVRRELARRLFTLDAALGLNASNFVLDWFKTAHAATKESQAAAAASGALRPLLPDVGQRVAS